MAALHANNNIMLLCTFVPWPTYPIDSITAEPPAFVRASPAISAFFFLIETQLELKRSAYHSKRVYFSVTLNRGVTSPSRDNRSRILGGSRARLLPIVERERQPVCVLFMTSANGALSLPREPVPSLPSACPGSPEHPLISLIARTTEQNGSRENVGDEETGAIDRHRRCTRSRRREKNKTALQ